MFFIFKAQFTVVRRPSTVDHFKAIYQVFSYSLIFF